MSPFLAALAIGLSMLAIGCAPDRADPAASAKSNGTADASPEVAGARATPPPPVAPTLPLAGKSTAADPQVTISDQIVRDGMVVVDQAIVPSDGWVAIYETLSDGAPGDVIGHARMGARLNVQVPVQLDGTFDGPTQLVAMLHEDTGDPERFDFPDGDPPFTQNGRPVVDRFTVRPSR